jgi:hypothetical protein
MNSDRSSFHTWLTSRIQPTLQKDNGWILWCDPRQEWLDLLRKAADADGFELWADPDEHELTLRNRFTNEPRMSRIVWLPHSEDDITWFRVFEPEADLIWETRLISALRDYGVQIPGDREEELIPLLPAYVNERFDSPQGDWKDFTAGSAKGELVNDRKMLEVLAGGSGEFNRLKSEGRFEIFARRAREDFGLPDPEQMDEEAWRREATAVLLCTEAAEAHPLSPPAEAKRIVPPGLPREHALALLRRWEENITYIPSFERTVRRADPGTSLGLWAESLAVSPVSKGSRIVEEVLFKRYVDRLQEIGDVEVLAEELDKYQQTFKEREDGFWGSVATDTVGWRHLSLLAGVAHQLVIHMGTEKTWIHTIDAIKWYTTGGWNLDAAGEVLFTEIPDLPEELKLVREPLRCHYLRTVDRIGRVFSDLLENDQTALMDIPTAGDCALSILGGNHPRAAYIFLDALRLDLGHRLAEKINEGEPEQRAYVTIARAPVPSITPLGKPFALPVEPHTMKVNLAPDKKMFCVTSGSSGNLTIAETWRDWFRGAMEVTTFLSIEEIIDGRKVKKATPSSPLLVVEGAEFDTAGHDGSLKLDGAGDNLDRYTTAVRKLRDAGYSQIIIVTDHGFFHWQPEADEIDDKPQGEILWKSRRAVVGRNLSHRTALTFSIPSSDLTAMVPRSVNAFKTYGGLGFFHGGATLQELIIPVVQVHWPQKAKKVNVVLKPVGLITSEMPRVQVEPGAKGQQKLVGADSNLLSRKVLVKVRDPRTGKVIFRHNDATTIDPTGGVQTIALSLVDAASAPPFGSNLLIVVQDADDEEILASEEVELRVEIDEFW